MKKKNDLFEKTIQGIFLILGLVTVGCVLLITIYLVVSGIPAIRAIGLSDFLFGSEWWRQSVRTSYVKYIIRNKKSYFLHKFTQYL